MVNIWRANYLRQERGRKREPAPGLIQLIRLGARASERSAIDHQTLLANMRAAEKIL